MKERLGLVLLAALSLSACNEQNDTSNSSGELGSYQGRSFSVIGKLRPQADPSVMRQIHNEEEARRQAAIEAAEAEMKARQAQEAQDANRNLPEVNNSNFGPGPLPNVGGANDYSAQAQQAQQAAQAQQIAQSWAQPVQSAPPPPASYGINYTQPSPGFVPPPPAVSLSTSAVPMPYGMPPPGYNPYANPYANPYQGQDPGPPATAPGRPKGSLFGSGNASRDPSSDDDDEPKKAKKERPAAPIITPTGMEARSPYKQRDELRMLWKGALASSLANINADAKFAEGLAKIDVNLPGESSKGALSVQQRTVDNLFKNTGAVDKKIFGAVKKTQTDLVQAYYRYLYSYNKFFLTQQQVQARKQELEYAESQAEKQRATVDFAQAQQEADATKEDMRSSQNDLASVVGAAAARTVIKNVSGVTPSLDSLAQADQGQAQGSGDGGFGGIMSVFGFGKHPKQGASPAAEDVQVANENKGKEEKPTKEGKEKKEKKKKDKGEKGEKGDTKIASAPPSKSEPPDTPAPTPVAQAPASSGPVSFELKDVKTTPRKSILRVTVKNTGADNFNFDVDQISVAEGNNRLTEASVSAEFDTTVVQPSSEVTGTITIFGRPWNDKITVSLLDGKKPIVLHR